jgi:hypothetical protein
VPAIEVLQERFIFFGCKGCIESLPERWYHSIVSLPEVT